MAMREPTTPYMDAMVRIAQAEEVRAAREAKMRNALEILTESGGRQWESDGTYARFVRATAREGLGR